MEGNKKVLEQLNINLSLEYGAVIQYMTEASMLEIMGYGELAAYIKRRAIDEMKHAEALIERILFLEGTPTITLKGINIGKNVAEILANDHEGELTAIDSYNESIAVAIASKDNGTRELFENNLEDEEGHNLGIEQNLRMLSDMGLTNYLTLQIAK